MWESDQIKTLRAQLEHSLVDFKISKAAGQERCAYHRGVLEGLKIAQELPEKQLEIQRKLTEEGQTPVRDMSRFRGLRFAG